MPFGAPDSSFLPPRIPESSFDDDTLEARTLRAEAAAKDAMDLYWRVENELRAVDAALNAERVPQFTDGPHALTRRTRPARVRWLGDQARLAAQAASQRRVMIAGSFKGSNEYRQMTVDDCIAEVERNG